MNFTKENVEFYWKVLNTSQSKEEKKLADDYLIQFKVINLNKKRNFRAHWMFVLNSLKVMTKFPNFWPR